MAQRNESAIREVSIRTIPFSGLDGDWREWHMKVKAVAKKKGGWNSALINDLSIVPTVEDAEEKAPRIKANDNAYLLLFLSTSKRAFLHVESSQENAYVAWTNLLERYKASDTMDLLSLLQDFTKCVMDGAIDGPCFWFMELELISEKIKQAGGNRKSDSEKIAHLITEAPREYVPVTDNIAMMIGLRQVVEIPTITTPNDGGEARDVETASTTNTETRSVSDWTWTNVRKAYQYFWKCGLKNTDSKTGSTKLALYASVLSKHPEMPRWKKAPSPENSWKKFKGMCNLCGIQGHKAADCQRGQVLKTAGANTTNILKGKCYTCGKVGHYYHECCNKPRENVGLFVGMTVTIDNEAWMPRKRSPAARQEAYFDRRCVEGSLIKSDEMMMSRFDSAHEEPSELFVRRDDMSCLESAQGEPRDLFVNRDEKEVWMPKKGSPALGLFVGMTEATEKEAWMPKKGSPALGLFVGMTEATEKEAWMPKKGSPALGLFVGMAEATEKEAWMPKKGSPATWQEANDFDTEGGEEDVVESDGMSVSSLESSTEAEQQDLLVSGDEMDGWTVTIQEVAYVTSEKKEKPIKFAKKRVSRFRDSLKSNLFSTQSTAPEGSVEKHMNEVMMLEEAVPEADTKQGTEPPEVKDPTTGTELGRCHFCKNMGTAGDACERCPKVDSGSPFICEKKLFDNTAMDPLTANMVQGQIIIVTHVTNRGGVNVHDPEPLKLELLKVEPNKGQQELPDQYFKEVQGEETLSYLPGYAEGMAELMMPVNNGHYLTMPSKGLQVYRKNSDGGFTGVPYEVGRLSYDVEERYVGGCQPAKQRAKAVSKMSTTRASKPGELIDTSGPYDWSLGGSTYWVKIMDEYTRKSWESYTKRKSEVPNVAEKHMEYCKRLGLQIEFLRCDNAGEHQAKLRAACNRHGIAMEYTAPGTPQQNGIVKCRFATDRDKALAMMLVGQLKPEIQKLLWAEATKYASLRTNLMINTATKEPPDKMWYGAAHWENRSKQIVSKMNRFGRIGYVKTKKKIAGKLVEKTTKCIHLSNAEDHPHDTYRMYNPMTRAVILTRNVTWAAWAPSASQDSLEHIFEQNPDDIADLEDGIEDIAWADRRPAPHAIPDGDTGDDLPMGRIKNPDVEMIPAHLAGRRNGDGNGNRTINDGDSEDDEAGRIQVEEDNFPEQTNADKAMTEEDQDPPMTTPTPPNAISAKSRKVASAMRKLQGYYNPLVTETLDKANDPTVIEPEDDVMDEDEVAGVEFSATLTSDPGEPQTFREAVDGPAREKWLPSTKAEVLGSISREAERVAGTECANEAMFQSMLLEELLGRKVQATILNDNTRAIFMVKNHTVGSRTKPIRVWHLYMRELRERGRVKVEFIPTAQNVSNIGTKNLGEKRFNKHTNRMLDSRILECLREDVKMYDVSEDKSSERARSPSPMSRNRMSQPIETDSCPSRLTRLSRVV
jgi:hypothetical protein